MEKILYLLACKYLKNNLKTTLISIIPMILSLVFSIFALFILFSFKIGIINNIKEDNIYSTLSVFYDDKEGYMNYKYKDSIEENDDLIGKIESFTLYYGFLDNVKIVDNVRIEELIYPILKIEDVNYDITVNRNNNKIEFFDLSSSKCYLDDEIKYMKNNNYGDLLLAGDYINNDNRGIMINSRLLDSLNINYNDIIGKKISYVVSIPTNYNIYYPDISYKHEGEFIDVFKDFVVVGVFNDNVYNCPTRAIEKDSIFWVNNKYLDDHSYYDFVDQKGAYYHNDPILEAKRIVDEGLVFSGDYLLTLPNKRTNVLYQYKDFESTYEAYNNIYKYIFESSARDYSIFKTKLLGDYLQLYSTFNLIIVSFATISIIVFVATLINMILIIDYQKRRKKHFLNMLRSLGYSKSNVIKIFNYQVNIQYIISVLISFILSFIISLIGTIVWNNKMKQTNFSNGLNYNINLLYFIPAFFIIIFIMYLIVKLIIFIYNLLAKNDSIYENIKEE